MVGILIKTTSTKRPHFCLLSTLLLSATALRDEVQSDGQSAAATPRTRVVLTITEYGQWDGDQGWV